MLNAMNRGLQLSIQKSKEDPSSAFNAGLILESRHMHQAAQIFFMRGAQQGHIPSIWKIAGLLIRGDFVTGGEESVDAVYVQDAAQGLAWLRKAAATGDSTSNYLLSHAYFTGTGVQASRAKALHYLHQVVFAGAFDPYESTAALVFGDISQELRDSVFQMLRAKELVKNHA